MKKILMILMLMVVTISIACKKDNQVLEGDESKKFWTNLENAHGIDLPDFWITPMKHTWKTPSGVSVSSNLDWSEERKAKYALEVDESIFKLFQIAPEQYTVENYGHYNIILKDPAGSSTEAGQCATFTRMDGQEVAGQVVGVNFIENPFIVLADPRDDPDTPECRQNRVNSVLNEGEHVYFFWNDKKRFTFFQGAQDYHSFMERIRNDPQLGLRDGTEVAPLYKKSVELRQTHIRR